MKNKYIKHILGMGCLCCTLVATLASCSSDDPYFTASENDAPRILNIDISLLAGDHILQIVATTTKGLQTSRTCKVVVRPLATDPIPDNKQRERLVKPGTAVTLHGKNMEHVVKVSIGDQTINCTYNPEGYVEYTIPADMAEGTYPLTILCSSCQSRAVCLSSAMATPSTR